MDKSYMVLLKKDTGIDEKIIITAANENDARWKGRKKPNVYEAVVLKRMTKYKKLNMPSPIEKISARASQLYNGGKGSVKDWGKARKQASKEYRDGKLGAVKIIQKGETKKSKVTKTLLQKRSPAGTFKGYKNIGNVQTNVQADVLNRISVIQRKISLIEEQIKRSSINKIQADTASIKKHIQRHIDSYKKEIKDYKMEISSLKKRIK